MVLYWLIDGLLWSLLWTFSIALALRYFPFTLAHDYPKEVQAAANLPEPSVEQRKNAKIFSIVGFVLLFGLLMVRSLTTSHVQKDSFFSLFYYIWVICMTWNIVDLFLVDWLLICVLGCKYFVLPGTEKHKANKNFLFHFQGFLKGFVVMSVFAFLISAICYAIQAVLK